MARAVPAQRMVSKLLPYIQQAIERFEEGQKKTHLIWHEQNSELLSGMPLFDDPPSPVPALFTKTYCANPNFSHTVEFTTKPKD